jgi:type VI protein secretion system component Hcp
MKLVFILALVLVAVVHGSMAESRQPVSRLSLHFLHLEWRHDERIVAADKNLRSQSNQKSR